MEMECSEIVGVSAPIKIPKIKYNLYIYLNTDLEEFKKTWESAHKDAEEHFFIVFVATNSVEECPDFSEISSYYYNKPLSNNIVLGGYYLPNKTNSEITEYLKKVLFNHTDFEDSEIITRGVFQWLKWSYVQDVTMN